MGGDGADGKVVIGVVAAVVFTFFVVVFAAAGCDETRCSCGACFAGTRVKDMMLGDGDDDTTGGMIAAFAVG